MFRQKSYSLAFHIPILNIKVPLCSQSINLTQNTGAEAREDAPCSFPPMAMRGFARYFEIEIKVEVEVEKLHPVFLP